MAYIYRIGVTQSRGTPACTNMHSILLFNNSAIAVYHTGYFIAFEAWSTKLLSDCSATCWDTRLLADCNCVRQTAPFPLNSLRGFSQQRKMVLKFCFYLLAAKEAHNKTHAVNSCWSCSLQAVSRQCLKARWTLRSKLNMLEYMHTCNRLTI